MTDTNGLIRDAGGPRKAESVDALIVRLNEVNRLLYAHGAITITVKDVGKRGSLATEAAAALTEQIIEIARLQDDTAEIDRLSIVLGVREHEIGIVYCAVMAAMAERDALAVEFRKVEVLWKEAAIDASRKHDTIGGLENACRISLSRINALQAENRLLRECARTPDLERIDAAIDAARAKEK